MLGERLVVIIIDVMDFGADRGLVSKRKGLIFCCCKVKRGSSLSVGRAIMS